MAEDDHYKVFGIFPNVERFWHMFDNADALTKARLYKNYQIDEYGEDDPCEPIDTIYISDVIALDMLPQEVQDLVNS